MKSFCQCLRDTMDVFSEIEFKRAKRKEEEEEKKRNRIKLFSDLLYPLHIFLHFDDII